MRRCNRRFSALYLIVSAILASAAPTITRTSTSGFTLRPNGTHTHTASAHPTHSRPPWSASAVEGHRLDHEHPPPHDADEARFDPAYDQIRPRPSETPLQPDVPYTDSNPNRVLWTPTVYKGKILSESESGRGRLRPEPEPERDLLGAEVLGPQNEPLEEQNADALAPPTTDNGRVQNFKWPFSLSHNKLKQGGWARQQNLDDMPIAKDIAGVNMRLAPGAIREMHWHLSAEWAYVLKGDLRVSTVTPEGEIWLGDVSAGDLWYFPAGNPHSIQAKDTTPEGAEFLLIFDDGAFSEDSTFLLTDWLAHVPKEVVAQNFGLPDDLEEFDRIPKEELYIFDSIPPPADPKEQMVIPNDTPIPYTFPFSKVPSVQKPGGTVKIVDSKTFNASTTIAAAEVSIEPGAMRELHWHPIQPEWTFFLEGKARITLFASESNAQTFDFYPGDIAYIPPSFGHYIKNTGNSTLKFLEVLKSDVFQDVSLSQWLALTPPALVKAHLGFSDKVIGHLSRKKQVLVK